jgi:hypothetical protein
MAAISPDLVLGSVTSIILAIIAYFAGKGRGRKAERKDTYQGKVK